MKQKRKDHNNEGDDFVEDEEEDADGDFDSGAGCSDKDESDDADSSEDCSAAETHRRKDCAFWVRPQT